MADRNAALCKRARAHGVELTHENEVECRAAEEAATDAEAFAATNAAEVARLRALLKAAEEKAAPLRERAKKAREDATLLRRAMLNVAIRDAQRTRLESLRSALERQIAEVSAKLAVA